MTTDERFLTALENWLEDEAGPTAPGYADEIIGRARDTRQHPSWVSLERRLPQPPRPVRTRAAAIPTGARVLAVAAPALGSSWPRLARPAARTARLPSGSHGLGKLSWPA